MRRRLNGWMLIGLPLLAVAQAAPSVFAGDRPDSERSAVVSEMSDDELDAQRAGNAAPSSEATLNATLQENTNTSSMTGTNSVSGSAFTGASGYFTVIQNSGNQVIIQDSTIINVTVE